MTRSSLEWSIEGSKVYKYIVEISAKKKTEFSQW